ncbi:MAG TPA: hypothetical protein VIG99_10835 [Myxococcaceae bacterium]|jgi:hypothetical protein
MTFKSTLLGITSMAASLGAIALLLASDVAVAEEPVQAAPQVQAQEQTAQVKEAAPSKEVAPVLKAKAKPRRKRIDLGRFEGY